MKFFLSFVLILGYDFTRPIITMCIVSCDSKRFVAVFIVTASAVTISAQKG